MEEGERERENKEKGAERSGVEEREREMASNK